MRLDIDPSVRQGQFMIEDDGSVKQTRSVKVTTGGEPVVGEVAHIIQMNRLAARLRATRLELEATNMDVETPEDIVRMKNSLKGLTKVSGQIAKILGKPK